MRRRIPLALLFATYLALLGWLVLWKLHTPYLGQPWERGIKLVPFVAGDGYGASAPLEVIGNVLVFVPFGVYLRALAPAVRSGWLTGAVALASVAMETAQYLMSVGRSDTTDVIANTAGGVLGIALMAVLRRRFAGGSAAIALRMCAVGTVLAVVGAGYVVSSLPRLPHPGEHPAGVSSVLPPAGP